uniref:Uncharacterized protein n=1 Tax=Glossina austeni TaxID=7395 RepID=A0A1A9UH18_GLOAU
MERIRKTSIAQQTYKANKMLIKRHYSVIIYIGITGNLLLFKPNLILSVTLLSITVIRRPCVPDKSSPEFPKRIQSIREWPGLRAHLLRKFPVAEPLLADFCDLIPSALHWSKELVLDLFW